MVFQTSAHDPHLKVEENRGFGLEMNTVPKDEIAAKVAEAPPTLKRDAYLEANPRRSGGRRQRVAIGRAIMRGPEVFLFDAPLSNLDAELRVELRVESARLHKDIGATMIHVPHDQDEAMTLADKIVVLRDGRVEPAGKPLNHCRDPDNRFIAGFIGSPAMSFLEAQVDGGSRRVDALGKAVSLPVSRPALVSECDLAPRRAQFPSRPFHRARHRFSLADNLDAGLKEPRARRADTVIVCRKPGMAHPVRPGFSGGVVARIGCPPSSSHSPATA